jgi:hypothetical protein
MICLHAHVKHTQWKLRIDTLRFRSVSRWDHVGPVRCTRCAMAHPPKKKLAPTVRHGAHLLFGARCAEALALRFHGAALSKWRSPNTCFPTGNPSANATRTLTVTHEHLIFRSLFNFGNITMDSEITQVACACICDGALWPVFCTTTRMTTNFWYNVCDETIYIDSPRSFASSVLDSR